MGTCLGGKIQKNYKLSLVCGKSTKKKKTIAIDSTNTTVQRYKYFTKGINNTYISSCYHHRAGNKIQKNQLKRHQTR